MTKLFNQLVTNEDGVILSAEMVLILTIAVLGMVVGLSELTTAITYEFQDLALAFYGLNQTYMTPTFAGCFKMFGRTSFVQGSGFFDFYNACIGPGAMGGGGMGFGGGYGGGFGGGYGGGYGGGGNGGGYSYSGGTYGGYSDIGYNCVTTAPTTSTAGACETCTTGSAATGATSNPVLPPAAR